MIKGALRYSRLLSRTMISDDRGYFLDDLRRSMWPGQLQKVPEYGTAAREKALDDAVKWLLHAQNRMTDEGFGSYSLADGWSTSYPETSGYIIPTLLSYAARLDQEPVRLSALRAADWLVSIQKPSGGWQAKRMADNAPEVVFNTGQVIRGMISAYKNTDKEDYLVAAIRAGDWLVSIQHPEGYWKEQASMDQQRVYDSYVDAPLVSLYHLTGEVKYRQAAERNIDWILDHKMLPNGWFEDCDNTVKHNDRPILHTLAYTLDGLVYCGHKLGRDDIIDKAKTGTDALLNIFLRRGMLNGRYNRNWEGSEHFICTGGAQLAITWLRMYRRTLEERYLNGAEKMTDLLIRIQQRRTGQTADTRGALAGSYPVWGRYEPFAFPNWATKFFADALMMLE